MRRRVRRRGFGGRTNRPRAISIVDDDIMHEAKLIFEPVCAFIVFRSAALVPYLEKLDDAILVGRRAATGSWRHSAGTAAVAAARTAATRTAVARGRPTASRTLPVCPRTTACRATTMATTGATAGRATHAATEAP